MDDLRRWCEEPKEMIEWLSGQRWTPLVGGGPFRLFIDDLDGAVYANQWLVLDDSVVVGYGGNGREAGLAEASECMLMSRSVWRTVEGYDIILGRLPTPLEIARHPSGTGLDSMWLVLWDKDARPSMPSGEYLRQRGAIDNDKPCYCIPLRADGRFGCLRGE